MCQKTVSEFAGKDKFHKDENTKDQSRKITLSLNATDRILFIDATGPFDDAFAHDYIRQITPLREALQPIAWGSLVELKGGENLLTDDSRNFLLGSIKGARQLGLFATALVLEEGISDKELDFWHSLYRDSGLHYSLPFEKAEAITFLILTLQKSR